MTELPGRVSLSDNTAPSSAHSQGALVDTNKKPGMVLVTQLVVSFVLKTRKKGFQIILPTNVVIVFLVQCSQGSKEQTDHQTPSYSALLLTASGGRQ